MHRAGVVALLREVLPSPQRYVLDHLSNPGAAGVQPVTSWDRGILVSDATTAALAYLVPRELPFSRPSSR